MSNRNMYYSLRNTCIPIILQNSLVISVQIGRDYFPLQTLFVDFHVAHEKIYKVNHYYGIHCHDNLMVMIIFSVSRARVAPLFSDRRLMDTIGDCVS